MRGAQREDTLIVVVARDGQVFFKTGRLSPGDLPQEIQNGLRGGAEQKVYIKADAHAHYRAVKVVLDAVHSAGLESVAFLADDRPVQPSSPSSSQQPDKQPR